MKIFDINKRSVSQWFGHCTASASWMGMSLSPHTHPRAYPTLLGPLLFFSQGRPIIINFGKSSNEIRASLADLPPEHAWAPTLYFSTQWTKGTRHSSRRDLSLLERMSPNYWTTCGSSLGGDKVYALNNTGLKKQPICSLYMCCVFIMSFKRPSPRPDVWLFLQKCNENVLG